MKNTESVRFNLNTKTRKDYINGRVYLLLTSNNAAQKLVPIRVVRCSTCIYYDESEITRSIYGNVFFLVNIFVSLCVQNVCGSLVDRLNFNFASNLFIQ